jgi:hypothetical protein
MVKGNYGKKYYVNQEDWGRIGGIAWLMSVIG